MPHSAPRDLRALPKAHLHLHLEGSMRPSTLAELAADAGITVPEIRGFGSFTAFADTYLAACQVLRTPAHFERLVYEVVEDSAADGAVWVEPSFYAPFHRDRFGDDGTIVDMVLDALHAAGERLGVGVGLQLAGDRNDDPVVAAAQARVAASRADRGVVAFGLANDETVGPPESFAEAFAIAKDAGLLSTPHAGELVGPESIWGALHTLQPDRLQHGVRAVEDPALVERLADSDIVLDVCPTSNVLLSVYPSFAEHPLPQLLEAGVRCSLNGDDPLLFGPVLLHEYEVARTEMGLDDHALASVAAASIAGSGAPDQLKDAALRAIDEWLAGTRNDPVALA